jgi:Flp pilus assembly protein TadD
MKYSTNEPSFGTSGTSLLKKLLPGDSKNYPTSAMQSQALIELRQGEIFELKGEWKQAQEKYKRSVESGGGAPALKKLAAIQLQRREYDDASKTIDALKDENPESEDVMLLEGILALRRGNPSEATAVFNTNPESPQGLYGLALVSIVNGDHEKAKTLLAKAAQAGEPAIRTAANVVIQSYN